MNGVNKNRKFERSKRFKETLIIMIVFGAVALFMVSCGAARAGDSGNMTSEYVGTTVSETDTTIVANDIIVTVRGTVESTTSRNVYTTLGYFIETVDVEIGDRVTKGQVLATLDTEVLELTIAQGRAQIEAVRLSTSATISGTQRMLNQASANISNNTNAIILNAQAAVNGAEANLAAIQNNYEALKNDIYNGNNAQIFAAQTAIRNAKTEQGNREIDLNNAIALYDVGAISQQELRNAENALDFVVNQLNDAETAYNNAVVAQQRALEQMQISMETASTAYQQAQRALSAANTAAQQEVDLLRSNVEVARTSMNLEAQEIAIQILERRLEDSKITAPISGTITNVVAREGMIGSGLLLTIEDTDDLRIITRFREYDIIQIREGMEVSISLDANGSDTYSGVIARINPTAVHNPNSPIVEFEAEVAVTSENTNLRIGMTTRLHIELKG